MFHVCANNEIQNELHRLNDRKQISIYVATQT